MSIPPNIDLFNRFCLAVFEKLYLSFPCPLDIDVSNLMMSVIPIGTASEEAIWNDLDIGGPAIEFLAAEGFLVYQGAPNGNQFMQVRLTMKGLVVLLGSVPDSLEKHEPLISKILSITSKGLKEAASDQVNELSHQAFAFALASVSTLAAAIVRI